MINYLTHAISLSLACAWFSANAFAATLPPQFNPNNMTTGWVGEVEFTSFDFSSNNECLIKADYRKADWTGNVFAVPVENNGNLQLAASCWDFDVAESVETQSVGTPPADPMKGDFVQPNRFIGTMGWDGSKIPFQWRFLDKDNQRKHFEGGDNTKGSKMLYYVRGDRTNEIPNGQKYRARGDTVLGDIIHSRPLYVPHPDSPRVYVGGNDGMLHAIDACRGCGTGGKEAWAYIPSFLIPNLSKLTETTTPYPHQYYVDATPNARKLPASVVGSGQPAIQGGKTVLVGGVGPNGILDGSGNLKKDPGKWLFTGLFALDISDPTANSDSAVAAKILWEITNATINNATSTSYVKLGYTYGTPLIVKMNDGNWAAVLGNGYAQSDDGGGEAVLFVVNLATGALIKAIIADVGGASDNSHPNGLSSPTAIDVNSDGMVDYVYAGDLAGNMWKFDVRSSSTGSWTGFRLFSTPNAPANANTIKMEAITGAPSLALHPKGGYMVMFGTGRAFTNTGTNDATHLNDLTNTTRQYVYGIWDPDFPASGTALSKSIDPTKLVDQTLSNPIAITSSNGLAHTVRTSAAINAVDYNPGTSQKQGWRLLLAVNATDSATTPQNAERVLGDGGLVAAGRYHVTLSNPNFDNGTTGSVVNARGDNWLLEVDYLTGTAPTKPIFDLNIDKSLDDADLVPGEGSAQLRIPVARRIAKGGLMSQPVLAQLDANGQTYFNLNPDIAVNVSTNNSGVSGGHFDFDIYWPACMASSGGYNCGSNTHVHEYDDKYNVTGVNMQNASLTAFNLKNAVSVGQKFKIIVANQFLSPAVKLRIGGDSAVYRPVFNFLTPTDPTGTPPDPGTGTVLGTKTPFSDSLPVYSRGGVPGTTQLAHMVLNMPLNAFSQLDWISGSTAACDPVTNANCRVGLIPTQTGCVRSNKYGFTDVNPPTSLFPFGNLWMNGAMTIQVIKDSTPDSAIRLASSSGDKKFGYRLKSDSASQQNQLVQYTIFWHHPNGKCYGESGWGTTAAIAYPDTSGKASGQTPAPGSDDPTDGVFSGPGGDTERGPPEGGGTPEGTPYTYTTPDGQTYTQYVLTNADGTVTVTIVGPDGQPAVRTFPPGQGPLEGRKDIKSGRQAWKQMIKP